MLKVMHYFYFLCSALTSIENRLTSKLLRNFLFFRDDNAWWFLCPQGKGKSWCAAWTKQINIIIISVYLMMKGFQAPQTDLPVANCVLPKFWLKAHWSSLSVFVWFQEVKYVSPIWMTDGIHRERLFHQSGKLKILALDNVWGRYFPCTDLHRAQ